MASCINNFGNFSKILITRQSHELRTSYSVRHLYVLPRPRKLTVPKVYENIEFPERRKLRFIEKAPQPLFPGQRMPKMPKQLIDIRGPELVHNFLVHKQYGIRALIGGQMHHGHFEVIRNGINRKIDESTMFAVWRVDPPWKPITKKGQGHRMGGGKGAIDHYVTPVKAGRIIVEMGGYVDFTEAFEILSRVAWKMPFKADVVSYYTLIEEEKKKHEEECSNLNPYDFRYVIENNVNGCRSWMSPYDRYWYGKFR